MSCFYNDFDSFGGDFGCGGRRRRGCGLFGCFCGCGRRRRCFEDRCNRFDRCDRFDRFDDFDGRECEDRVEIKYEKRIDNRCCHNRGFRI